MRSIQALLLTTSVAASHNDLKRAKTKVPGDAYKGDDQQSMSKILNGHLLKSGANVKPCEEWTTAGLQEFMGHIAVHRNKDLMKIYGDTNDKRSPSMKTFSEHLSHWSAVNEYSQQDPEFEVVAREGHCRQAVMWWVHHLDDEKRSLLRSKVQVPLLPEGEKKHCGRDTKVCDDIYTDNTCDWCHSTQAARDSGVPGSKAPDAHKAPRGPDDGNPKGWDRVRRCDQNYDPPCGLCEGVGGHPFGDKPDEYEPTTCTPVATPDEVDMSTVYKPLYPKVFTAQKDGFFGELDTMIGWQKPTDSACFSFFPSNDSSSYPLCYRDQSAITKLYDPQNEKLYFEYTIGPYPDLNLTANTSSIILHNGWQMWVINQIPFDAANPTEQCVCTNPSGDHCTHPPCYSYAFNWNTFEDAEYIGREKIGVEWIEGGSTGNDTVAMELDHFNLWPHHIWTDPVTKRIVRLWQPFNGLQVYPEDAWTESIDSKWDPVFDTPPAACKLGGAGWRIHCDDDGNFDGSPPPQAGLGHLIGQQWREMKAAHEAKVSLVV